MQRRWFTSTLALAAMFLGLQAVTLHAQEVPFKGAGEDAVYFAYGTATEAAGNYHGLGNLSHFGQSLLMGNVDQESLTGSFFPTPDIFFDSPFAGTQTFIAANGDSVTMEYEGHVTLNWDATNGLAFGEWTATGTITEGTGRFSNASGEITMTAVNPPFNPGMEEWPFDWYFDGVIDLGKKGKKK